MNGDRLRRAQYNRSYNMNDVQNSIESMKLLREIDKERSK